MGEARLEFSDRWMFNRVLCQERVCRRVIRAAFGIDAGEITYLNAEQACEPSAEGRGVRMDVVARGGGRCYDIEMQMAREPALGRRMRYYQAAMDASELERGDGFGALPESYILFVCLSDAYGLGLPEYTLERACLEAPGMDAGDGSHWKVLNACAWADAGAGDLRDLLRYLREGSARGELSREIDSLVDEYNGDRKWVSRVMMLEEDIARRCRRERAEGREEGLAAGREEGRAEGRAQGAEETAALMARLLADGRIEDASRAATDADYRRQLLSEGCGEK